MSEAMKKKSKSKLFLIIGCMIALVAVIVVCVVIGFGKEDDEPKQGVVTVPYEDVLEEGFEIETPYVTLSYPSKWKNEVEIKHIDEEIYTVEFYRAQDGKESVHLFDIVFGGESGDFIGSVVNDNKTTEIYVISYPIDDSISGEELETIGNMLEDVNHIILTLEENKNFKGL